MSRELVSLSKLLAYLPCVASLNLPIISHRLHAYQHSPKGPQILSIPHPAQTKHLNHLQSQSASRVAVT